MNNFGEQLRKLRIEKGLTSKELAEKSGVTAVTICNIETGKTRPQGIVIKKLADALEVEFEVLYRYL